MISRRIAVVASEILGMPGAGGAATADSFLAVALARHGHSVELLVAPGRPADVTAEWAHTYRSAGVSVRALDRRLEIRPPYLGPPMEVFHALRAQPPDVVISDDWRGLSYAALRARQAGLALTESAFIVHCHGPANWLAESSRKVPDRLTRFGEEVAERTSVDLADVVVSPSRWLLDWMRARGWPIPESVRIIQYVRQSVALGEPPETATHGAVVRRLAFFGPLREGKGVRLFLESLRDLEAHLLDGIELLFLGSETRRWTAKRIETHLHPSVIQHVRAIRFETELDRAAALDRLRLPGTLAIMPSLLDNSPNTVSECIEHGIPFLAARVGGIPELVGEEDRERVLFEPTANGLADALRRALTSPEGVPSARPARDPQESLDAWLELVEAVQPRQHRAAESASGVTIVTTSSETSRRARRLAEATASAEIEIVSATSRRDGLSQATTDWIVFLDEDDVPDDEMIDALVAAQTASSADVVTAAVRPADDPEAKQLFLGKAGALGLVENQYGVLGLVRGSVLTQEVPEGSVDPDWPLFARLALAGARIVSIPEALSDHNGKIGQIGDVPGEGLTVLRAFERAPKGALSDLPALAATLAVAHSRLQEARQIDGSPPRSVLQRSLDVLRAEGVGGVARRASLAVRARSPGVRQTRR